jgi:hypothetical protein
MRGMLQQSTLRMRRRMKAGDGLETNVFSMTIRRTLTPSRWRTTADQVKVKTKSAK